MKTANSVNWTNLIDESPQKVKTTLTKWATESLSTRQVTQTLAHSNFSGEFRKLVRNNGTTYGRRLARKALRYRGVNV